jgi:hypothetical protein
MPSFAGYFNFTNTLQSLTKDRVLTQEVIDTVIGAMKGFQYLRQKGLLEQVRGGLACRWQLNVSLSPNTVTFDGDDNLPIASMNSNIITAALDWKKYTDALVVVGTDELYNDGSPDAVATLVDAQLDVVKMSLVNKLAGDWVTNTQALNAKGLNGLAEGVDNGTTAGTYAGISRTTYPSQWNAQVNYSITTSILQNIHTLDLKASIDAQRPDFYMTNTLNFAQIIQGLFSIDRYYQPDMARAAGGTDLIFNGNPLFLDSHCPTGTTSPSGQSNSGAFFGLNSSFIKLFVHPDWYFRMTDWQMAQNNLSFFSRVLFAGNVAVLKPSSMFNAWIQNG